MDKKIATFATCVKNKREGLGYSLRRLSEVVGVGFSTLSRLERLEGCPDHNTIVRLLNWLGDEGKDLGFEFQEVALVHFRAAKNADTRVVQSLAQVASHIAATYKIEDL